MIELAKARSAVSQNNLRTLNQTSLLTTGLTKIDNSSTPVRSKFRRQNSIFCKIENGSVEPFLRNHFVKTIFSDVAAAPTNAPTYMVCRPCVRAIARKYGLTAAQRAPQRVRAIRPTSRFFLPAAGSSLINHSTSTKNREVGRLRTIVLAPTRWGLVLRNLTLLSAADFAVTDRSPRTNGKNRRALFALTGAFLKRNWYTSKRPHSGPEASRHYPAGSLPNRVCQRPFA